MPLFPRVKFPERFPSRLLLRLPRLTASERAAALVLSSLLVTGAALHAWERSGAAFGPVEDLDTLRAWVLQARAEQGDPEFPCDAAYRSRNRAAAPAPTDVREETKLPGPSAPVTARSSVRDPIDINTADQSILVTLPGIGPATAQAILRHRETHGRFAQVDDLLQVRGIGPKKLEDLRPHVRVEPRPARQPREAPPDPSRPGKPPP